MNTEKIRILVLYPWPGLPAMDRGASLRLVPLINFLSRHVASVEVISPGPQHVVLGNVTYSGYEPRGLEKFLLRFAFWVFDGVTYRASGGKSPIRERRQLWHYIQASLQFSLRRKIRKAAANADIILLDYPFWSHITPRNKPVVLTLLDVLSNLIKSPALREKVLAREVRACKRSDAIICVSPQDRDDLKALGVDAQFVPHGYELPDNAAPDKIPGTLASVVKRRDAGHLICLFVGSSLLPNQEAVTSIQAIAESFPDDAPILFVVAGACCGKAQLMNNLTALGVVSDRELNALYALSDVALAPISSGSGSSTKIIEAMAREKVLVTSPMGARGWDITSGDQAIVCEISDFAAELRKLMDDPALRKKLAASGREYASGFGVEKTYQPYLDAIRDLVKK